MKFIEALRLRSKLFLLFILITLGLVILGMMGTINTRAMKSRIDNLYFGTLIPVTELNDILYTYNANILPSIYKAKNNLIAPSELQETLYSSLKEIEYKWKSYKSHYKSRDELAYVGYASQEIDKTNRYFYKVLAASKEGLDMQKLSISILDIKTEHINSVIKKLLDYEMSVARFERRTFLQNYHAMMRNMGLILGIIIFAVLFVTYSVFKSIQKEHTKLEAATKKLRLLNKKLENASYTDSLTSLHNRRYFNFIYERELRRAKREKKYVTFMMIDIDFFKQYNDTYGHIAGDHTLQIVAKVIKSCFKRPSDFVFRLGGEEFGVLLLDTDELNSARLAKELCKKVKEQGIEHKASKVADVVTISVGVVSCIADDMLDGDDLIRRADDMLYKAKEGGRDRYMITSEVIEKSEESKAAHSSAA